MRDLDEVFRIEFFPEQADIRVGEASYLLIRREAYCHLHRELASTLGRGAEAILYRAGHERGKEFFKDVPSRVESEDPEDILTAASFLASRLGLYNVISVAFDRDSRRAELAIERSFEVCEPQVHERPQCHYIRGFWSGVVGGLLGEDITVIAKEEECQGMGDAQCRFAFTEMPR